MSGPDDILPVLNVHHLVMALGNIAKGFPEPSEKALATDPPAWIPVFKQSTEAVLAVLERMNRYKVIRDAVRVFVDGFAIIVLLNLFQAVETLLDVRFVVSPHASGPVCLCPDRRHNQHAGARIRRYVRQGNRSAL